MCTCVFASFVSKGIQGLFVEAAAIESCSKMLKRKAFTGILV